MGKRGMRCESGREVAISAAVGAVRNAYVSDDEVEKDERLRTGRKEEERRIEVATTRPLDEREETVRCWVTSREFRLELLELAEQLFRSARRVLLQGRRGVIELDGGGGGVPGCWKRFEGTVAECRRRRRRLRWTARAGRFGALGRKKRVAHVGDRVCTRGLTRIFVERQEGRQRFALVGSLAEYENLDPVWRAAPFPLPLLRGMLVPARTERHTRAPQVQRRHDETAVVVL